MAFNHAALAYLVCFMKQTKAYSLKILITACLRIIFQCDARGEIMNFSVCINYVCAPRSLLHLHQGRNVSLTAPRILEA